jgi:superfamily I DNA/RNA helicase
MPEEDLRALHERFGPGLLPPSPDGCDALALTRPAREMGRALARRLAGWRRAAAGAADLVVHAVVQWMEEHAPDKEAVRNIGYAAQCFLGRRGALEERLRGVGLARRKRGGQPHEGVAVLCTLHGAKGLEWDSV